MAVALLIYIFVLGFFFLINKRKYGFNGGTFLVSIYLIGSILALYLLFFTNLYDENRLEYGAIIYHTACLLLFLYPIVYVSNRHLLYFKMPSETGLNFIYVIIIGFSFFSYVSFIPKIGDVLAVGNFKDARNMYNYGEIGKEGDEGLLGYLAGIGSSFCFFALYFCFYNLKNHPEKKKLILLLLLCSFTDVILSLTMVGRGGIMRWALMMLFLYFSFSPYLNKALKRQVIKLIGFLSIPVAIFMILITVSRFSEREYPTYVYMFDYIGQSFIYFSYNFEQFFDSTFGGRMNFPILFPNDRLDRVLSEVVYTDYNLNTFATFVGSFYKDMGFTLTFTIAFFFFISFMIIFRFNRSPRSFYKLFLYIVFAQMIVNGIFYFQYTGTTKIRSFILIVIFAAIIQFFFPNKSHSRGG